MNGLFIQELQDHPRFFVSVVLTVVVSVTLHELGHVFAALRQGDPTPRQLGHLTWNPIVHMGWTSIVFLLLAGIAWGRTPVNPWNFRGRHGRAIVSWSGPAVNLVLAVVGLLLAGLAIRFEAPEAGILFLRIFGTWNVVLFLFNMVPVPPLDGASIVANYSPRYAAWIRNPSSQPIVMAAFLVLFFVGGGVLFDAAEAVAEHVISAVAGASPG
jgi:Zn-dependent protease